MKNKALDPRWDTDARDAAKHIRKLLMVIKAERTRSAKLIIAINATRTLDSRSKVNFILETAIKEYEASHD